MEVIKEFEVELDISDRQKLYDYSREQYIYRSEKVGDFNVKISVTIPTSLAN